MKVEFISKQIIKPSSPTPRNLRTFKLSFIDQLCPINHTLFLLFYPNLENDHKVSNHEDHRCERLKTSLSEILTHFYPLAGRVKDNKVIECNDEGAEFCETRVHSFLSDIFEQPDANLMNQFVPIQDAHLGSSGFLLKVQVNLFDCGGLAVGMSLSHKIADGSTIGLFIKAWSTCSAGGSMNKSILPKYIMEHSFPSMECLKDLQQQYVEIEKSNIFTRRYVFDSSSITKLKAKAASELVENPTTVEAVCALIWKCATKASRTNLGISERPSKVGHTINIRKRINPPLPKTSAGNCFSHFLAQIEETNDSTTLQTLVFQLRKAIQLFSKECAHKFEDENNGFSISAKGFKETGLAFKENNIDFYLFSSWCHLGFYEADFGWGKPKWVSPCMLPKNFIVLMDTSDGKGIEAWVTLSKQDIALMERNHELLEFVSFNPIIL